MEAAPWAAASTAGGVGTAGAAGKAGTEAAAGGARKAGKAHPFSEKEMELMRPEWPSNLATFCGGWKGGLSTFLKELQEFWGVCNLASPNLATFCGGASGWVGGAGVWGFPWF